MPAFYTLPLPVEHLRAIAAALRVRDVWTPSFRASGLDPYDAVLYLEQAAWHDTSTILRADRNVLTRIIALARGDAAGTTDHRVAAGILAFAQCANVDIEPNLALYEVEPSSGVPVAAAELAVFRRADNSDPRGWADVALGRADRLAGAPLVNPTSNDAKVGDAAADQAVDFQMPLRRWRRNYVLCLKLATLELEGGDPFARMTRYLSWMYEEFLLGGPALMLGAHYLAPNSERGGLLKGLRGADRNAALRGVRNAAWDLTLVSEWLGDVARQATNGRLSLLATFDVGLRRILRALADLQADAPPASEPRSGAARAPAGPLAAPLTALWGARDGSRLAAAITVAYGTSEAPGRQVNRPAPEDYVDREIAAGEAAVRAWVPGRRRA